MKDTRKIKDLLYEQVARIGKVFSSPKRLELIELLCQGEKTVETLAREASISMKMDLTASGMPMKGKLVSARTKQA